MKRQLGGIYTAKDAEVGYGLWHDCKKYKDRSSARVQLILTKETEDKVSFKCPHCGFKITIEKDLY